MEFRLAARERSALEELVSSSKDVRQLKRSQALLALASGTSVSVTARSLCVARNTIYNWVARFQERCGSIGERLTDAERCGRPNDLFQNLLKRLPALLAQKPTDFGYRHAEWTVDLLCSHLAQEQIETSDNTLRRALHELGYRWKRPRFVPRRRAQTWRQSKGGCSVA
jgi:transposase